MDSRFFCRLFFAEFAVETFSVLTEIPSTVVETSSVLTEILSTAVEISSMLAEILFDCRRNLLRSTPDTYSVSGWVVGRVIPSSL